MLLGILLALVIVVCVALVGVILLQRSEGGVLGMSGGGGAGNFMSARGTGDLLTRTTQILAGVFFALCLLMTLVTGHIRRQSSLENQLKGLAIAPGAASTQAPASSAPPSLNPGAPSAPAGPTPPLGNGLNLFGNTGAPAAPPRVQPAPPPVPVAAAPQPVAPQPATPKAAAASSAKPAAKPKAAKPASSAPASSASPSAPLVAAPPLAIPPPPAAPAPAAPAGQ